MKIFKTAIPTLLATISLTLSIVLFSNRPEATGPTTESAVTLDASDAIVTVAELRDDIQKIADDLHLLKQSVGQIDSIPEENANAENTGEESSNSFTSISQRLQTLESQLSGLQSNYNGISIEGASEEREKIFASEDGAIKADEYFEAGKFAIAAEGYMTYYRNHLDDPDARSVLERARKSYGKAGYKDMELYLQEEMLEFFPENRAQDLETLATLHKEQGNYEEAVKYSAEAADLMANPQQKLWTRLYWAWYNELQSGPNAGLDAYREVQQEISDAGFVDHALNVRAQEKIDELLKQLTNKKQRSAAITSSN